MSDPKVFDEIPSFLEPSGDTPKQPIKRVLTDLKNIGQAFREGHEGEFRSVDGLKRRAKEILGSLMGERSDEVRQQVQNLAEQALGEVKSNNLEQAGETIIDLLNASPKIREVEGNTMDAEQLLDQDEVDVSEFLGGGNELEDSAAENLQDTLNDLMEIRSRISKWKDGRKAPTGTDFANIERRLNGIIEYLQGQKL
jgi:hypothetical protein